MAEAEKKIKTVRVRVAAGRTVQTGNPTRYVRRFVDVGGQSTLVTDQEPVPGKHEYAEGEWLDLPEAEAIRLHAGGYVKYEGESDTRPLGGVPALDDGGKVVNAQAA